MPNTLRRELARKTIHVASSVLPIAYALGTPRAALLALFAALGAVAAAVEVARLRSARARALFVRVAGPLLREREHGAWSGASWLLAAYALAVVLFPRAVAVAAMLAAAFGDASAAVVGRSVAAARARRGVTPAGGKTLAGSVACAVVTFAAALLIAALGPIPSAACAVAAAAAERWDRVPVDDNVRVTLAAGGAAWLAARLVTSLAAIAS